MKVDLSVPVIRDLIVEFSGTIKKYRDKVKNLRTKNKSVERENFHLRCLALDSIMVERSCSIEEANAYLQEQMSNRIPRNKNDSVTVN